MSGVAHSSTPLVERPKLLFGKEGNAGYVPKEIGEMLEGRSFRNFDHFRSEFWKAVARSKYAGEFKSADIVLMHRGCAPVAKETQHLGSLDKYVLHHSSPIQRGGEVYDLSNIFIVTPKAHVDILDRNYHFSQRGR